MRRFASVVLLLASIAAVATSQAAGRVQLAGSGLTILPESKTIGTIDPARVLNITIGLRPRHPLELKAFCDAVSNPASPSYRQFMTPGQVGEAFGASASDVDNVVSFLKSQGLKVGLIAKNRMAICVEATVARAQIAFGTTIKEYIGPSMANGQESFFANSTPISLPSSIVSVVTGVAGLDNYGRGRPRVTLLTPTLTRGLYQTANAYTNVGLHGEGRTIAIVNADGIGLTNVPLYVNAYGLPSPAAGVGTNITISTYGTSAWNRLPASGEGDLDLQMELGMAPLSHIIVYDTGGEQDGSGNFTGASNADYIGLTTLLTNDNLADVVSDSYGWYPLTSDMVTLHNQHLSMTAQGMTYTNASGDQGTQSTRQEGYYPNIDPEVLEVGGTRADADSTTGARITEDGWGDWPSNPYGAYGSGGGWDPLTDPSYGGVSASFNALPSWQHGTGVPTGINFRLFPDVAMHSAGSGDSLPHEFYINGSLETGGFGTSFASPIFAGCLAIVEQRLVGNGLTARMGRLQDTIYSENGRADAWFDTTTGDIGALPDNSEATGHAGWDFVTGWGAPNFDGWYRVLASKPVTGTVTLQDYASGAVAGTSITVQFFNAGTSTLVDTETASLSSGGGFTVTTTAPTGSYDVYVKASHWLRRKLAGQTLTAGGMSGLTFSLINGDVDGNNAVGLSDFARLKAAFGSLPGDANWNANADLDGNQAVGLSDFAILKRNFGLIGD